MKAKSKKLTAPNRKKRNFDQDTYYVNRIAEIGMSARKVERFKRRLMKDLKIDEFRFNDVFFRFVLRKKEFGEAGTSLEMAFSKLLSTNKPVYFKIENGILTAFNLHKSIVLFLFEENGVVWATSDRLKSVGYFKLEEPQYLKLYQKWTQQALVVAFEQTVLSEEV